MCSVRVTSFFWDRTSVLLRSCRYQARVSIKLTILSTFFCLVSIKWETFPRTVSMRLWIFSSLWCSPLYFHPLHQTAVRSLFFLTFVFWLFRQTGVARIFCKILVIKLISDFRRDTAERCKSYFHQLFHNFKIDILTTYTNQGIQFFCFETLATSLLEIQSTIKRCTFNFSFIEYCRIIDYSPVKFSHCCIGWSTFLSGRWNVRDHLLYRGCRYRIRDVSLVN